MQRSLASGCFNCQMYLPLPVTSCDYCVAGYRRQGKSSRLMRNEIHPRQTPPAGQAGHPHGKADPIELAEEAKGGKDATCIPACNLVLVFRSNFPEGNGTRVQVHETSICPYRGILLDCSVVGLSFVDKVPGRLEDEMNDRTEKLVVGVHDKRID
ncbi:hypothetical protein IFR04_004935 [Cadophora malorum]|uniref:Uncharacterized protein n=1 Tax=Cadophora malorum TaxID=108018 RepID=A0A8H8BR91_9HELO|nr:hypothetical protein IFR04_004935 [Cadophora malorum]